MKLVDLPKARKENLMQKGTLKQILLITDGCSNKGEDPAAVAAFIAEQSIAVNVIGILEEGAVDAKGLSEIEEIAASGQGESQIVYSHHLSQTVQSVTKKSMTKTLQGVVNQELKQILGEEKTLEDLPPEERGEIMEVVNDMEETCDVEVLVLVDSSASMTHKLPTVQEALIDLSVSMNARIGRNRFAIYHFPGKRKVIQKLIDWTGELKSVSQIFPKLAGGGITPTGPALKEALKAFSEPKKRRSMRWNDYEDVEEIGF